MEEKEDHLNKHLVEIEVKDNKVKQEIVKI